jgi:O-antigen ligase
MFSIFFILWTFVRRRLGKDVSVLKYQRYVEALVLGLALYVLGGPQHSLTQSATATGAMAVTLAVFSWLLWKRRRGTAPKAAMLMVMMTLIIGYGTATPFLGRLAIVDVSSSLGRDATLTDRTEIWAELVPIVMREPILGKGFGSFWNPGSRDEHEVSEAHCGYLDIILEQGFVGLLILSMFLLSSCWKAQMVMTQDFDWGALWICCLVMTLLHNITESSLNSFTSQLTAVLLFLRVSVPERCSSR